MRVAYLINGLGTGGAERSLAEMLPLLDAAGVQVTVVCLQRRDEGVESAVVAGGADVRVLTSRSWPGRVAEARRLLRALRPDVVHTTIFDADVVGRLAAARLGPVVMTSLVNTSYDPSRELDPAVRVRRLRVVQAVDGWTARHLTDHFHAITHAVADAAVPALGIDPTRVSVVERGRDERRLSLPGPGERVRTRAALGLPDDAQVLLNVGRQEFQKGQVDLLRAVRRLLVRRPGVVLLQAGRRGAATREVEALATQPPLAGRVRLLGHREDVPALLGAADVFVFPSRYEGLGGSVVEAMATGVPVVASDVPALREVLADGGGVLVPPGDDAALADALEALLADPDRRGRLARQGREAFAARFTLARSAAGMVDLYRRVLSERGR